MSFIKEHKVLTKIAKTPKTTEKKKILEENKDLLRKVVLYALDITKKYNIKKFPPQNYKLGEKTKRKSIFELLDTLASVRGATLKTANDLAEMCSCKEDLEVVRMILNKDLRCGINLKTAEKIYPELPSKKIMLCDVAARVIIRKEKKPKISPELEEFVKSCGGWDNVGVSDKENGVRDKIIINSEVVTHMSRNGLTYPNFSLFDEALIYLKREVQEITGQGNVIFDGEVVSFDEDFQKQMTQVRRLENMDPSIFELRLFDIASLTKETQARREKILKMAYDNLPKKFKRKIKLTLCKKVKSLQEFFVYYNDLTVRQKKEGVVLKNMKGKYENKRSKFWCKVKTFFSVDLKVIRAVFGKAGKKYAKTLGALVVDFKGVEVNVGSGYSDKERDHFIQYPPDMIEVEYKEVTKDGSLYIPTFARIRLDK